MKQSKPWPYNEKIDKNCCNENQDTWAINSHNDNNMGLNATISEFSKLYFLILDGSKNLGLCWTDRILLGRPNSKKSFFLHDFEAANFWCFTELKNVKF